MAHALALEISNLQVKFLARPQQDSDNYVPQVPAGLALNFTGPPVTSWPRL